jgi:hypothetical protein
MVPAPVEEPDCVLTTVKDVDVGIDATAKFPLNPEGDSPEMVTG